MIDRPAALLLDIEGTIAPISFVKEVMFPRAAAALAGFIAAHATDAEVLACLDRVRDTVLAEEGARIDRDATTSRLLRWIDADRKHPALKELQGRIWQAQFEAGLLTAPFYDDVPPVLRRLREGGVRIAVYSSGAALAQRLFFRHSNHGDLSPLVEGYFDLAVGPKHDPPSYLAIAGALELAPPAILFLTDSPAEVDAARRAGVRAMQIVRPGSAALAPGPALSSFDELSLD